MATGEGLVEGRIGGFRYEVRILRAPVSYGLNPQSLYKGRGRITSLTLWAPRPGTTLERKVARYDSGWIFGRQNHVALLARLLSRLDPA